MSLGFAEENGGIVTVTGGEHFDALLMSRLDFEVRVLEIPPVSDREIETLIGLRLRSVYPGNPRDTAFDFRVVRQGGVNRAVVFIARRATVDAYREAGGRRALLLPYLLLWRRAPRRGDFRAWVWNGTWAEHLVFHDGVLTSSTVRRLARGRRFDLAHEESRLKPGERVGRLVVVARAAEAEGMERLDGVTFTPFESLLGRRRSIDGIFGPRKRKRDLPPASRIAVLAAALLLLGLLLFFKVVRSTESYDARLRAFAAGLQKSNQQVLAVEKEIDELQAQRARLDAEQPRDLYLLLSELSAVLGDNARIRTLSVRDDTFQIDASGVNPLKLMEGFASRPSFSGMKLSQVVPDPRTGRELFSFSGVYHAR